MADKPVFSVSVSEETYGDGAPITLQGGIRKGMETAASMGYEGVELQIHTPGSRDFHQFASWAREYNLSITALGTGLESAVHKMYFTSADEALRIRIRESFKRFIDGAEICHASVFLGLCRGMAPSLAERGSYLDLLAEEYRILVDYAGEKGVMLVFEPIVFYLTNLVNSTDDGLEFLSRPGLEPIKLLLDTHHMFIEDKDMMESFRKAAPRTGHIHISDSNRQFAGSGNVDYAKIGAVLKEIDYDGPLSLESLPVPSGEESAKFTLDWMREVWP